MIKYLTILFAGLFCFTLFLSDTSAENNIILIRYREMIDADKIVRTGESIADILSNREKTNSSKAILQPHLDRFVELLPDALDMVNPHSIGHFKDISEYYRNASAEPLWTALFQNGKYLALFDGDKKVRLFIPGTNPKKSYIDNYGVLRHCLASIAEKNGRINIEVFAYQHNYYKSEIKLNTNSFIISAETFPIASGKIPLNLSALNSFFKAEKPVAGAEINSEDGLTLFGYDAEVPRINGKPVSLSDFAVAYRAAFHSGDNAAFISLDPNLSPCLATVNFGGYLENTAIGQTVLECDKRFKTIASGLDPNTFEDRSDVIRNYIPNFLSVMEKDLLRTNENSGRWIGTRFWFYPESVEIETDENFKTARIMKARFTADAERQRGDFANASEFERYKRTMLSPSIRDAIRDLNVNYEKYAAAFPELKELDNVARLLGICSWLKRNPKCRVDLDALLSVEIPVVKTPESRTQLLVSAYLVTESDEPAVRKAQISNRKILYLSPYLEQTAAELFYNKDHFKQFLELMIKERGDEKNSINFDWESVRNNKMKDFITHKTDLQSFLKVITISLNPFSELISQQDRTYYSAYVMSIGGGINLGADEFTIKVRRRSSRTARTGRSKRKPSAVSEKPVIRITSLEPRVTQFVVPLPAERRRRIANIDEPDKRYIDTGQEKYWFLRSNNGWKEKSITPDEIKERRLSGNKLEIIIQKQDGDNSSVTAQKEGNVILFRKNTAASSVGQNVPDWWNE